MITIYPFQVRFVINALTDIADNFEAEGNQTWFALATAAACLENLLHAKIPVDIEDVTTRLKALQVPNPGARRYGKTYYYAVNLAITIIDGSRLGLLVVQPETQHCGLAVRLGQVGQPVHQLDDQFLPNLHDDPQQSLTNHFASFEKLKEASVWPATTDARRYDQGCSEVRHA